MAKRKDKKRKSKTLVVLGIIIIVLLLLALFYVFEIKGNGKEKERNKVVDCLEITFKDNNSSVKLAKNSSNLSDTFETTVNILNKCEESVNYSFNLESLVNSTIDADNVYVSLDELDNVSLGSLSVTDKTLSNAVESYVIINGSLKLNGKALHKVKIWIDKEYEEKQSSNRQFVGELKITK